MLEFAKMIFVLMILWFWAGILGEPIFETLANGLEESPVVEAFAAVGGRAFLPCDLTPPNKKDSPLLVLFFRGSEPIYSVDARDGSLEKAIHWTSTMLESRHPSFAVSAAPHGLILPTVQEDDDGDYHCRVDFMASPTRNLRVKLHVAVPPSRISLVDGKGAEVHGLIGPYPLGDTLTLTCIVTGGRPRPKVTWWYGSSLLDEVMEELKSQMTTNSLTFPNLTKNHLGWKITCQAVNSNLTNPVMATVEIGMTFPPSEISIEGSVRPVNEGNPHEISCSSSGSRPPANITWWKDGELMKNFVQTNHVIGNWTKSTISIIPNRNDDGSVIACRAENSIMPGSAIEDTRKLIVFYPPSIQLRPGPSLNLDDIKEGDDVYFECLIQANPRVFRIEWMLNNRQLHHRLQEGIIVSNQSLVLQKVARKLSGDYSCRAANTLGKATSSSVFLRVKYAPYCAPGQQELHGVGRQDAVNVTCEVGGEPPPSTFYWTLNTTTELLELPTEDFRSSPGKSVLYFQPKSHTEFGTILCWGENSLGKQAEACTFQVVPAAPPEGVRNCSVSQNASSDEGMITIFCNPGWDGGLPQTFSLEVRASQTGIVLAALTDQELPIFSVSGLPPGKDIHLSVIAKNSQGDSPSMKFIYFTPIDIAEERLSAATSSAAGWSSNYLEGLHFIGVIVGVLVILALSSGVLVAVVKTRAASHARQPKDKEIPDLSSCKDGEGFQQSGPDVILVTSDDGVNFDDERELGDQMFREDKSRFYPKAGAAPLDENKISYQETDVLLPSNYQLGSSLLPSSLAPSILSKSTKYNVGGPPSLQTTSPFTPLIHPSQTLPILRPPTSITSSTIVKNRYSCNAASTFKQGAEGEFDNLQSSALTSSDLHLQPPQDPDQRESIV